MGVRRKEQQRGDDEKREDPKKLEGVIARRRIKKEAALQLERRVQTTLRRVGDR